MTAFSPVTLVRSSCTRFPSSQSVGAWRALDFASRLFRNPGPQTSRGSTAASVADRLRTATETSAWYEFARNVNRF